MNDGDAFSRTRKSLKALTPTAKCTIAMVGFWATFALSTPASACRIGPPHEFSVADSGPPGTSTVATPELLAVTVTRSRYAPPGNGDCGELGSVKLKFGLSDVQPWPADLGLRVRVIDGTLFQGVQPPAFPLVADLGEIVLLGGDKPDEAVNCTLRVTAVDRHGNESAPVDVPISDPNDAGCTIARGPSGHHGSLFGIIGLCAAALIIARRACSGR
jgi:hypothetical protein